MIPARASEMLRGGAFVLQLRLSLFVFPSACYLKKIGAGDACNGGMNDACVQHNSAPLHNSLRRLPFGSHNNATSNKQAALDGPLHLPPSHCDLLSRVHSYPPSNYKMRDWDRGRSSDPPSKFGTSRTYSA